MKLSGNPERLLQLAPWQARRIGNHRQRFVGKCPAPREKESTPPE
jgi:hypothetical protein